MPDYGLIQLLESLIHSIPYTLSVYEGEPDSELVSVLNFESEISAKNCVQGVGLQKDARYWKNTG